MNENDIPLQARLSVEAPLTAAGRFMFMPAGEHIIQCSKGTATALVKVLVDESAVAALNAQLADVAARKSPQRPYCDFNHDQDKASFWPSGFVWQPDGVYVEGEFSASGKAAVEGKDYRCFSPTFHTNAELPDKPLQAGKALVAPPGKRGSDQVPAKVINHPRAGLNFGGLVNEPAFEDMKPLFAKAAENAGASSDAVNQNQIETEQMKKTIAELQAAKNTLESQVNALQAKATKTEIETAQLGELQAKLHSAEQDVKIAGLEASEVARLTSDADAAVARAVKRGAVPAQDAALQAKWKTNCANNPDMIVVLDAIQSEGTPLTAKISTTNVELGAMSPKSAAQKLVEMQAANCKIVSVQDKIKQAKEVHALYAKEISGNKHFADMPLNAAVAADTEGTLAGTLVALRTLELYKLEFPVLGMITSDYSDQPANYGQTTTARIVTVPAIMTYDATIQADGRAKGWVIGTPAQTTDVSLTLNNHKAVEISFDANVLASTVRRLFDEQAEAAQYALGKDLVDALYAVYTAANFGANAPFAEASVDFGRRTFSKVSRILNKQGVPRSNRFALINSDYFEKLEQDPTLVSLAVYQKPEIITGSQLPQISRFTPIEASNLPATGNMAALFGHRSSAMIQTRVPNDYTTVLGPSSSYGQVSVVTNPDTGASALLTQYVSHQGGYAAWRLAWMYAVAKANNKGGQIVSSQ